MAAKSSPPHDVHNGAMLRHICKRLCYQLSSDALGPRLAEQSVTNLLYATVAAYQSTPTEVRLSLAVCGRRDSCATYVHLPSPSALMLCQLLHQASEGSDDGSGSEKEDEADKEAADQPTEDPDTMHWVFNRISRLIRPRRPTCRAAGLRWMGAVASKLEAEQLRPYLVRSRWWLCIIRRCVAAVAVAHDAPVCWYRSPQSLPGCTPSFLVKRKRNRIATWRRRSSSSCRAARARSLSSRRTTTCEPTVMSAAPQGRDSALWRLSWTPQRPPLRRSVATRPNGTLQLPSCVAVRVCHKRPHHHTLCYRNQKRRKIAELRKGAGRAKARRGRRNDDIM